jgi:hypothetical protein
VRTESTTPEHYDLEEYRIRASRLMKSLRGADLAAALQAARRFRTLPNWAKQTAEEIHAARDRVQRKHALAVIAREAGFRDWLHLRTSSASPAEPGFDTTRLFQPRVASFLNLWYVRYDQAREAMGLEPKRYLFPYRHQFVLCEAQLLGDLGVDVTDPDWERIGRDWVKPPDAAARARLAVKLRRIVT